MPGTTPKTTAQPDPRSPYVVDTHDFARRPGSMRKLRETVPAPEFLGDKDGVATVPAGSDVDLDVRLEAVVEGVLATGTINAGVAGECVRCLEPLDLDVEAEFQELYFFPGEDTGGDEDAVFLVNDLLDLEPIVHDAVVLALPSAPCAGTTARVCAPNAGST